MKTFIKTIAAFVVLTSMAIVAQAQANQKTFETYLASVYDAYHSGDEDAMWAFYTDKAAEINPGGQFIEGKDKLMASWKEFSTMLDKQPTFTYELTSWRLITPDVALVTWNSTADIQMQGQQVGGPSTCVAVLHKIKGKWYIEFDGMTPVMEMPTGN
jgi:uncharacterized protein (TIGR02246 family)